MESPTPLHLQNTKIKFPQLKFMKMQKSLFIAVLLLLKLSATGATPEKRVKSTIKEVTVYLSGAKLTNVANVSLSSGNSEVIFDNLPIGVNPSSMQIRFKGGLGATLLSAKFRTHYEESASVDAKILRLMRDSLTDFQDRFKVFSNEREVLNGEQNLLFFQRLKVLLLHLIAT